jgi:hypothetical protein
MIWPVGLLACSEGRDVVVVNDGDYGKPRQRDRPKMSQMGYAVELDLERDRDLLFHLFCGMAGPLGNDLDVGVRHIRISFDGKIVERDDAPYKEDHCEAEYQDAIVERQIN